LAAVLKGGVTMLAQPKLLVWLLKNEVVSSPRSLMWLGGLNVSCRMAPSNPEEVEKLPIMHTALQLCIPISAESLGFDWHTIAAVNIEQ
jgi:hypothetical protein